MSTGYSYRVNAVWTSGRRGTVQADSGVKALDFSAPPEFQGEPGLWTPEHLFVAAVASCFITTFRAIADLSKFKPASLEISVQGTIDKSDGGYGFTYVVLKPHLTVERDADRERGVRLLEKTERACLVSRSLKSEIGMEPIVEVASVHAD